MKKNKWYNSPIAIGLYYLSIIIVFSFIYSSMDINSFNGVSNGTTTQPPYLEKLGLSSYFSIITITTLGYGDVSLNSSWGRFWCCLEVILGILILGLFLNSLAIKIGNLLEVEKEKLINEKVYHKERKKLLSYNDAIFSHNLIQMAFWITPVIRKGYIPSNTEQKELNKILEETIHTVVKFSGMSNIFEQCNSLAYNHKTPIIEIYFHHLKKYIISLEQIIMNIDLKHFPKLNDEIIQHIRILKINNAEKSFCRDIQESEDSKNVRNAIKTTLHLKDVDSINPTNSTPPNGLSTCCLLKEQIQSIQKFTLFYEDVYISLKKK